MNVYIYGGKRRDDAKVSLVAGNQQPDVNTQYHVNHDSGILVIAFPDLQQDVDVELQTNLQFDYWIEGVAKSDEGNQG